VRVQARWWAIGYGAFVVLSVASGLFVRFAGTTPTPKSTPKSTQTSTQTPATKAAEPSTSELTERDERIGWRRRFVWLGVAFIPSSLMLGVTTHISTDLAPVPLMWVVPLALYLATFIIAFAGAERRWLRPLGTLAGVLGVVLPAALFVIFPATPIVAIGMDLVLLIVAGLACHGLLARDRPGPRGLTEFYLVVSAGGALGGLFNGLLAPVLFNWVAELPVVIAALAAIPLLLRRETGSARAEAGSLAAVLGRARLAVSAAVLVGGPILVGASLTLPARWGPLFGFAALAIWAAGIAFVCSPKASLGAAVCLALILFGLSDATSDFQERTFFGTSRVRTEPGERTYIHGNTVHGIQLTNPSMRRTPTGYYTRSGPVNDVFTSYGRSPVADRVAVVGLGAGGMAAYGRSGQRMDFYEIDPAVIRIARDPRHFTYLRDCPCDVKTVSGDGRLRIAAVPDGTYGMIFLDAFSSDAVPTHLLTREALAR